MIMACKKITKESKVSQSSPLMMQSTCVSLMRTCEIWHNLFFPRAGLPLQRVVPLQSLEHETWLYMLPHPILTFFLPLHR